jgi:hypothetical protein
MAAVSKIMRFATYPPRASHVAAATVPPNALAKSAVGVAIIPSTLRTHIYDLQIVRVTFRGKPVREPLTILRDKRRPLPPYATAFCHMLAEHVREVFPITRPFKPKVDAMATHPTERRERESRAR